MRNHNGAKVKIKGPTRRKTTKILGFRDEISDFAEFGTANALSPFNFSVSSTPVTREKRMKLNDLNVDRDSAVVCLRETIEYVKEGKRWDAVLLWNRSTGEFSIGLRSDTPEPPVYVLCDLQPSYAYQDAANILNDLGPDEAIEAAIERCVSSMVASDFLREYWIGEDWIRANLTETETAKKFAEVAWIAEDVQRLRPNWTTEECEEFLVENESLLAGSMTQDGWGTIEALLPTGGEHNTARDLDDDYEYSR
jgi:hypothetical protein